jgi:hypothetical protein
MNLVGLCHSKCPLQVLHDCQDIPRGFCLRHHEYSPSLLLELLILFDDKHLYRLYYSPRHCYRMGLSA